MKVTFDEHRFPFFVAERMIESYKCDEWVTVGYSAYANELRYWLEIIDELDDAGYDPRWILKIVAWDRWWLFAPKSEWKDAVHTHRMALDIWTRGYLARRAAA